VFESREAFEEWLTKANFHFDKKAPIDFLKTITGIRFRDGKPAAMKKK
jgi:uncharacterized protein (DUF2384 family)